jgi:hypothetical protein
MHKLLVLVDGVLAQHTLDVAAQRLHRGIGAPREVVEVEVDRDPVPHGEILDLAADGSHLGGGVGGRDAPLDHFGHVAAVQHGHVAEVERDGVDLDENVVRLQLSGELLGRGLDCPGLDARGGAPEGFVGFGDRHCGLGLS